ncbi:MAG: hypothetical protein K8L99_35950 [Anaerolineae bacterium]|nr:hypothetical protein [Anaerolineae bacterium]
MLDTMMPVMAALSAGDRAHARRLLRPMLEQEPSADLWVLAAQASETPGQKQVCLERALALDPNHAEAKQQLRRLRGEDKPAPAPAASPPTRSKPRRFTEAAEPSDQTAPALSAAPPLPVQKVKRIVQSPVPVEAQPLLPVTEAELPPLKKVRRRKKRGVWWGVGCVSMVLLSLTSSYIVLLVLGSSLPGNLRSFLLGGPTPTFSDAPDAVYHVSPSQSNEVERSKTRSDVLEPGYAHEVLFEAARGDEMAVAIQFFSPAAQGVGRNVAIFDPNGYDAGVRCQRNQIFGGDSGAAFICQIDTSGFWTLRVYGREGESAGAYFVSVDTL